ncbi:MAG: WecB/TagA/CpsF family glycosyltransferase [Candidatus Promineofilum sp.]|nr:WecB/TagA/CpsF family glycosyltransferase [Promineifilum sp.]
MPRQEAWLRDNWHRLDARVALTGGAVFDYISGDLARAPRWMTDNGLEWLGRLLIEPKRLWRRYLLGNLRFCCASCSTASPATDRPRTQPPKLGVNLRLPLR